MTPVVRWFIRTAITYLLIGVALGETRTNVPREWGQMTPALHETLWHNVHRIKNFSDSIYRRK